MDIAAEKGHMSTFLIPAFEVSTGESLTSQTDWFESSKPSQGLLKANNYLHNKHPSCLSPSDSATGDSHLPGSPADSVRQSSEVAASDAVMQSLT